MVVNAVDKAGVVCSANSTRTERKGLSFCPRCCNIPSVGIGPLAGDLTQAGGRDEWVDVKDYIRAIKICAQIIVDWSN